MTKMSSKFCANFIFVIIIFSLLLSIRTSVGDDAVGKTDTGDVKANISMDNGKFIDKISQTDKPPSVIGEKQGKTSGENRNNQNLKNETTIPQRNFVDEKKNQSLIAVNSTGIPLAHPFNPGAMKRAIYVLGGLSIVVLAYLMFRSSRLGKSPAQMVRKYGVLAHKQDIEMRPLPLDEDDEDDTTVFDVSGLSPQRTKHHENS